MTNYYFTSYLYTFHLIYIRRIETKGNVSF